MGVHTQATGVPDHLTTKAQGVLGSLGHSATRVEYLVGWATRVTGLLGPLVYLNQRSTRVVDVLGPESSLLETLLGPPGHCLYWLY
jgi:hypothetical protein